MRITIVMGFFLPVPAVAGGATEKIWLRLAQEMAAAGHALTIISRRWPSLPDRETTGSITHLRVSGWNHTRWLPINLLLDLFWGWRVVGQIPVGDVVVCNTVSLPVYLRRWRPRAGRVAVVLGRMPKGQVRTYGSVDALLATSEAVAAQARRENPQAAKRIVLFPNPIDWSSHARASAQGKSNNILTLGYVGRIHREKGLELLLEAAVLLAQRTDLPSWRLVLVGPVSIAQGGSGENYLAELKQRYGAQLGDRLHFLPPVFDAATLASHYGQIDVFCYPSLAAQGEGLSIAPLEAMAAGAVPVLSRLDCYNDVIRDGVNGFQFDQQSPSAVAQLTTILERLLGDDALRRRVATQAQADVRRFDYGETAAVLLAAFARLTGSVDGA